MADAQDLGFELLPDDDEGISPQDDLDAAALSALNDLPGEVTDDPPLPFGSTWLFDWEKGRFVRSGGAPARVRDFECLAQWCQMVMHSARYAHDVFGDDFGMEEPENIIGEADISELLADYKTRIEDALLVHDRIVAIEDFEADYDPSEGVLTISNLAVVTDEEQTFNLGGLRIEPEV